MPFRVSIRKQQLVGPRLAGWSENYWNSLTSLDQTVTQTKELAERLEALTGSQAYITSARISDVSNKRLVKNVRYGWGPTGVTTNLDGDYPNTALLLKLSTLDPYIVRQWMRGLPDSITSLGGTYQPNNYPGYADAVQKMLTVLTTASNGWSLRILDKNVVPVPISAINLQTGIVNALGHGFGKSGSIVSVRLRGFQFPKQINRVWQCHVIDNDNFQCDFWAPIVPAAPALAKKPTARLQSYVMTPIVLAEVERASSHYTGRPTDLLGSRRRTRRSTLVSIPAGASSTGSQLVTVAG